jgi:hypothetical protein
MLYIGVGGRRIVMDRRSTRIGFIIFLTALAVGVLPVIPVGEVLAPGLSDASTLRSPAATTTIVSTRQDQPVLSPVADATTIEKLRLLFSR